MEPKKVQVRRMVHCTHRLRGAVTAWCRDYSAHTHPEGGCNCVVHRLQNTHRLREVVSAWCRDYSAQAERVWDCLVHRRQCTG